MAGLPSEAGFFVAGERFGQIRRGEGLSDNLFHMKMDFFAEVDKDILGLNKRPSRIDGVNQDDFTRSAIR